MNEKSGLPEANMLFELGPYRFLSMFDNLHRQHLEGGKMRFGHICSPSAAPPALIREFGVTGWPKVGVVATVTRVHTREDGTLLIDYELTQRFQILSLLQEEPYPVALAMDYEDESQGLPPAERAAIDEAELEVYRSLLQVEKLSQKLHRSEGSTNVQPLEKLPEGINRYAPPPPSTTKSLAQALSDAGCRAGHDMEVYQRASSMYDGSSSHKRGAGDPYAHVSEKLNKAHRQELFSFAAASLVDGMGNVERLVLLNSRDTAGRLQWVGKAIGPYLQELQAKVSVMKALRL